MVNRVLTNVNTFGNIQITKVKKDFTKVIPTKIPTIEKQLGEMKSEFDELRAKRRELMFRLRSNGFTLKRIGEIYGCTKQYVEKELSEYVGQFKDG